jgi:hypothetical protein
MVVNSPDPDDDANGTADSELGAVGDPAFSAPNCEQPTVPTIMRRRTPNRRRK